MPIRDKSQLKPGRKRRDPGLSYTPKPPQLPTQKTFRADEDFLELVEARALKESLLTGLNVRFSDLVRRGLQMVLDSELPEPARKGERVPCALFKNAAGATSCATCMVGGAVHGVIACPRLNREVRISE